MRGRTCTSASIQADAKIVRAIASIFCGSRNLASSAGR